MARSFFIRWLELTLGLAGAVLTAALLVSAQRLFGQRGVDTDIFAALLLLASGAQAVPLLGLGIVGRDLIVHLSRDHAPIPARPKNGDNIGLVFVVTFGLAFIGVFALLYSSVFVPLVLLAVVAKVFYRPLSRNTARARAVWRVLALAAVGFGSICMTFVEHTRLP